MSKPTSIERLYLLQLGTTSIPLPNGTLEMVSAAYLLQTRDSKYILIDSGLPEDYAPAGMPPSSNPKSVLQYLSDLNLSPDDIDMLICTHFDIDHIGYNDSFTQAEHIVQAKHYELARNGHERFAQGREHWDYPAIQYRMIDGDLEILPGLTLLETSGHAPFHQSLLVNLPQSGAILLAIDAVVMERLFTPERQAWAMDDNEEQLRASTQKLLDIVKNDDVRLTVFGHDGLQWQKLKIAPDYYA